MTTHEDLAKVYEEGILDRMKSSVAGVGGGIGGVLTGQGFKSSSQKAKLRSLVSGTVNSILKDIQRFERDIANYTDGSQASVVQKATQLKAVLKTLV